MENLEKPVTVVFEMEGNMNFTYHHYNNAQQQALKSAISEFQGKTNITHLRNVKSIVIKDVN